MPHLSPMSWLSSIAVFWVTLSLFASTLWWTNPHLFNSEANYIKSAPEMLWSWS
uniref:ATP synthase F0 subunit 8 n=1 Tax=Eisenia spelaea TaxID=1502428 RepID=A0A6B9ITA4_9ANNE|nr:ATP synthase F0 subunit 8 [Eisenia spelaea]